MDTEILNTLRRAGLSEKEIKAYIVLLEMGPQHANALARNTHISRANIYYQIELLREKELITTHTKFDNVQYFKAEPVGAVVQYLKRKQDEIEQNIGEVEHVAPKLEAMASAPDQPEIPNMKIYDSIEKVERLYDEIMVSVIVNAIVNIDRVDEFFPKFGAAFPELVAQRDMRVLELVVDTDGARSYKKSAIGSEHKVKILSKEFNHKTDILIYNNKVAFISYEGSPTAFVIENPAIYDTQIRVFDELWKKTK